MRRLRYIDTDMAYMAILSHPTCQDRYRKNYFFKVACLNYSWFPKCSVQESCCGKKKGQTWFTTFCFILKFKLQHCFLRIFNSILFVYLVVATVRPAHIILVLSTAFSIVKALLCRDAVTLATIHQRSLYPFEQMMHLVCYRWRTRKSACCVSY